MYKKLFSSNHHPLIFFAGLVLFTGMNIFSALTSDLHFDESYYTIWSQNLSFGYFDHPPMIAWLIKAGQLLFEGEFGVRFFVIVLSTFSMVVLWRIVQRYSPNALLFWSLVYAVCLIHPYVFIATPDAPLFFFSIMFFYFYDKYLKKSNFQNAVLLAFFMALMIYSKYHAILLLGFVFISNIKMLKKFSFWLIIFHSAIYLFPHFLWQFNNDFPSFKYHLIDRHIVSYSPIASIKYIFSQLLLTGPIMGWFFLYILFSKKAEDKWEQALRFSGCGIFIFFLITTFSGNSEAHWTLVAIIPLIILSYKYIANNQKWQKWVLIAGLANFAFLLLLRIIIVTPLASQVKILRQFSGNKESASKIKSFAGNTPIIFQDAWTDASLYTFYSGDKRTVSINSGEYRRNQFDIIDADELYTNQTVIVLTTDSLLFPHAERIKTNRSVLYGKKIDNFRSYYNLTIELINVEKTSDSLDITVSIKNPYPDTIRLGSDFGIETSFQLSTREKKRWALLSKEGIGNLEILPEGSCKVQTKLKRPSALARDKQVFLMLKIGELKPIQSKCLLEIETTNTAARRH
jgi:hypothetical protein